MADEDSPNRATVALVAEMVRGLRELTQSEFENTKLRLSKLDNLPVAITKLEGRVDGLEDRVTDIEAGDQNEDTYRRVHLPTLVLTVALICIGVGGLALNAIQLFAR